MTGPVDPAARFAGPLILWLRAAYRPAAVVFIGGWVFAFRGGMSGSLPLVAGMTLTACLLGGLAGGLVAARPPVAGIAVSALSAAAVAIAMVDAGRGLRVRALGEAAGAALDGILAPLAAGAVLAAFAGSAAGLWLRRRWDARRSATGGGPAR
ncbi:MAG: hypothetical protein D6738_07730 [Acidobacteria bacterium]|nr:MAG: hypothetical protein D6738_07730 [Acidobacteriota bacterium]